MKVHLQTDYASARRLRYPPLADLADAMYHLNEGNEEPMQAYLDKVRAVKARCPKPAPEPVTPEVTPEAEGQ